MKLPNAIFNRPTTSSELEKICNYLGIPLNGIKMKDELNLANIQDGFYIINLQNHNQNGSHWTALYKNKKHYYYADSFGVPLPQTLIDNLKINANNLFYMDRQVQELYSKRCGFYAIYFLYCIHKNGIKNGLREYVNSFNFNNQDINEEIIKKIFLSL